MDEGRDSEAVLDAVVEPGLLNYQKITSLLTFHIHLYVYMSSILFPFKLF